MFRSRCNEHLAMGINTEVLVEVLRDKLCDVSCPFLLLEYVGTEAEFQDLACVEKVFQCFVVPGTEMVYGRLHFTGTVQTEKKGCGDDKEVDEDDWGGRLVSLRSHGI